MTTNGSLKGSSSIDTNSSARTLVLTRRIEWLLAFFALGLLLSGLTAFPLEWEVGILSRLCDSSVLAIPDLCTWIRHVKTGLHETYSKYPFVAYGTDWLAFAHLILAVLFWGARRDPVRNLWVTNFGLIACAGVIPLAMICGPWRGIPFYWRLIDCSFGVFGFIPLWFVRIYTLELERLRDAPGSGYR